MKVLGVDIGGSGVKGAIVDLEAGSFVGERLRIPTPLPATPQSVMDSVAEIVDHFGWTGPVGCGYPGVVRHGTIFTAANLDDGWIGVDAAKELEHATGCPFTVLNDADSAGLAEMRFGAGKDRKGVVLVLTLGTGIGSALFVDGHLVPNTEFGHIEIDGKTAEQRAASVVRERKKLSWKAWAKRLDRVLERYRFHFWPDLVILGGGISRKHEKFIPLLHVPLEIVPAHLRNRAGIIGAALAARPKEPPTVE